MRKPSIKTLERAFPGRGVYLRHLLDNTRAVNENPAVIEWADSCYHEPPTYEKRLCAINNAIDGGRYCVTDIGSIIERGNYA